MKTSIAIFLFFHAIVSGSIYDYTITSPSGKTFPLAAYKGMKIMIAILPASRTSSDSAFLSRLDSIALAHKGQLQIIAIPSNEEGFKYAPGDAMTNWYKSALDPSILISQSVYTMKASGNSQDGLFGWLTHSDQNTHFDKEAGGAGSLFFIDGQGQLCGVFGPEARFGNQVINFMFQQNK